MKLDPTQRLLFDYEVTLDALNRFYRGGEKEEEETIEGYITKVREECGRYIA